MDINSPEIEQNRRFMQCPSFTGPIADSDQTKGVKPPAFGKEAGGTSFVLPPFEGVITRPLYGELLDIRRSIRKYSDRSLSQEQLVFILWSAQGIQSTRGEVNTLRPVPSGGARHPFETYIAVKAVDGLNPGLYHYLPTENPGTKEVSIETWGPLPEDRISPMLAGQSWAAKAPAVLLYTCIPYRAEWRYKDLAHRVMLIDLGHLGQNVMLSSAALGLGSCCMAAFDQSLCDETLGLDGLQEYTVYAISIGWESP